MVPFKNILLLFLVLLFTQNLFAQNREIAEKYIHANFKSWDLTPFDIKDIYLENEISNDKTGITRLIYIQRYEGIEIFNAICNLSIKEGKVYSVGKRFIRAIQSKINTQKPQLNAKEAISAAAMNLGLVNPENIDRVENESNNSFLFSGGNISNSPIPVQLKYQPTADDKLRLAWDLSINMKNSDDWWSIRIDALDGKLLSKNNWTVYCSFDHGFSSDCLYQGDKSPIDCPHESTLALEVLQPPVANNSYKVYPYFIEAPSFGPQSIVIDPANSEASPFGWHDTNGAPGPDYIITRGNNVHAFLDLEDDDVSNGDEPNGGVNLEFIFDHDTNSEPEESQLAAVTNLFYSNNILHDISFHYGFDEQAGNFQHNNYGNGGDGGDFLKANAQDGLSIGSIDNANMSTPDDGLSPRMQMYLWNTIGNKALRVESPVEISGFYATGNTFGGWGGDISNVPITGEVILVNDEVSDPYLTDACEPLSQTTLGLINNKIAMIDRGGCEFGAKVLRVEEAGAIAAFVCNFEDDLLDMSPGFEGASVTIPAVFLSATDCITLKAFLDQGLTVSLVYPESNGPEKLDGDFDNGVIAHEYAHGISNRLTGGPEESNCLSNDEQMGEGWSDFVALMMSAKESDTGEMPRGVGSYVSLEEPGGRGIRRYPYSTDMEINPLTFSDVAANTEKHALGEVWATMLWDLFWAMVEAYGFSEDLYNGNGGNNKAIQLIFTGMGTQPCNPGFVDGRDAILDADQMLYDGANECLIWNVFARRGLGFYASQGDPGIAGDGYESFEQKPECVADLKLTKTATELIAAGDEIEYTLTVTNHIEDTVTNVVVSDELASGLSIIPGSSSIAFTTNGSVLTFELGEMVYNETITFSYKTLSDPTIHSFQYHYDDMEEGDANWIFDALTGTAIWDLNLTYSNSGSHSMGIENTSVENRHILQYDESIQVMGTQPVLRFFHRHLTEPASDGGIVEILPEGATNWEVLTTFFKNDYNGFIQYTTFVQPNVSAYWGDSNGFIESYADLSGYIGQSVDIRFRFGSDNTNSPSNGGWWIDDFEILDLYLYQSEACVISDQSAINCAQVPSRGTAVLPDEVTNTELLSDVGFSVMLFPNPSDGFINVSIKNSKAASYEISVLSVDGRLVKQLELDSGGSQIIPIDVQDLKGGMYMINVMSKEATIVEKIIIN